MDSRGQIVASVPSPVPCQRGQISDPHRMLFMKQEHCTAGRHSMPCASDKLLLVPFLRGEKWSLCLLGSSMKHPLCAWVLSISPDDTFAGMQWLVVGFPRLLAAQFFFWCLVSDSDGLSPDFSHGWGAGERLPSHLLFFALSLGCLPKYRHPPVVYSPTSHSMKFIERQWQDN